jgi:hypothetical protein
LKQAWEDLLQTCDDESSDDDTWANNQGCSDQAGNFDQNGGIDQELNQQLEAMLKTFDGEESNDAKTTSSNCDQAGETMTNMSSVAAMGVSQNRDNEIDAAAAFDWETGAMVALENDTTYCKPRAATVAC